MAFVHDFMTDELVRQLTEGTLNNGMFGYNLNKIRDKAGEDFVVDKLSLNLVQDDENPGMDVTFRITRKDGLAFWSTITLDGQRFTAWLNNL